MSTRRKSSIVVGKGSTVLETAVEILEVAGKAMGPTEIAKAGIEMGYLKIPRGRTLGYVSQSLQTKLQANVTHENPRARLVKRPRLGQYKAR